MQKCIDIYNNLCYNGSISLILKLAAVVVCIGGVCLISKDMSRFDTRMSDVSSCTFQATLIASVFAHSLYDKFEERRLRAKHRSSAIAANLKTGPAERAEEE